jgi:hypothetical protein
LQSSETSKTLENLHQYLREPMITNNVDESKRSCSQKENHLETMVNQNQRIITLLETLLHTVTPTMTLLKRKLNEAMEQRPHSGSHLQVS